MVFSLWQLLLWCGASLRLVPPCVAAPVPKTIWSFWHDLAYIPKICRLSLASWRHFAPEYEIRFLDGVTYREHIHADVNMSSFVSKALFADWLRINLLAEHGGVWLDSSIILTAPLDHLVSQSASISGAHLEASILEPYFLAAAPGGDLITRWRDEFERIVGLGEADYDLYLAELKGEMIEPLNKLFSRCDWADTSWTNGVMHWFLQTYVAANNLFVRYSKFYLHPCGQHYWMRYLKLPVALNAIVGTSGSDARLVYMLHDIEAVDSLQTLSAVNALNHFDSALIVQFLMTKQSEGFDMFPIRGVKLRSVERNMIDLWEYCEEGSIVCRVQKLTGTFGFAVRNGSASGTDV